MRIFNRHNVTKAIVYGALYILTSAIILSVALFKGVEDNQFPLLRVIIIIFASVLLTKYFIYMLLSPWHDLIAKIKYKKSGAISYNPRVSVIIPAWNEEVGLLATVKTLLKSTYTNLEIVVVNDGSTDSSDALMKSFVKSYRMASRDLSQPRADVIYYYKENGGKGAALNTAIGLSTGDIIISIDADCVVTDGTIANFVRYFQDPTVMAAVGNVKIGNTRTLLGTIQYLEFLFSFYFKKADSLMNTIYIIGGAAGAFRREVFEKIGLYSTTNITEDIELSVRVQDAGMKIVYASDAVVYTEGATQLAGLMKQRLRWKRGRFETFQNHKHLFFSTKQRHNKILTWSILPLALFGEVQLFMEFLFLGFLYIYSYLVKDFSSFISGIIVVSSMFFVQMIFDDRTTKKLSFYMLAPIGWLLFYLATFVEYSALIRSVWGYYRKKEVAWQRWQRNGVIDNTHLPINEV